MTNTDSNTKPLRLFMALMLAATLASCGGGDGGKDPILGGSGVTASGPTVTAVAPLTGATNVPVNTKIFTAAFSRPMDAATLTPTSLKLACPLVTPMGGGAVTYQTAGNIATLTLPVSPDLPPSTICTATVTTAAKDVAGIAVQSDFVWTFTTGTIPDITPPTVTLTVPVTTLPGPTPNVPINTAITATFDEEMAPESFTLGSFTLACALPCVSPVATPTYTVGSRIAVFDPPADLENATTYTATLTTTLTDLAGNPMAANYVWTFTTVAADVIPPTVVSTNPTDLNVGICMNKTVFATFSEDMNPATILANFSVKLTSTNAPVVGLVAYDVPTKTASFDPTGDFTASVNYTATITGGAAGVEDLAGNPLAVDKVVTFTTGTNLCAAPIVLVAASTFGSFGGGAGMTNEGIATVINGDIGTTGVSTTVTGLHDSNGDIYTETPLNIGSVTGFIYTAPPSPGGAGVGGTALTFDIATAAALDARNTFDNKLSPAALPGGVDPGAGQLGGLTVYPGIYQAAGGSFLITGSDLTLDAQGDPNAVWVFQAATSLSIGEPAAPRNVILTNGAKAKNVFWWVGSAARIEDRSHMVGTIIAEAGVTISTPGASDLPAFLTTLEGRALGLNASVTVVNTVITLPAP